jgi:hypothetical protein
LHTSLLSPICATCLVYLIILDLVTQTIAGEEYRSLNFKTDNIVKNDAK